MDYRQLDPLSSVMARRVTRAVALIVFWACGTTAATWVVNDRGDAGPLEVLTVQPAHADLEPDPINPATRAQAQREDALTAAAARVHLLQAAALLDAARKAMTTTTTAPPRRTVVTATVRARNTGGAEQWRGLVAAYGDWDVDLMLAIIRCESGGRPDAVNRSSGAAGLTQIYPAQPGSFDPATNIAQAHAKFVGAGGYSPWVSSRGCWG